MPLRPFPKRPLPSMQTWHQTPAVTTGEDHLGSGAVVAVRLALVCTVLGIADFGCQCHVTARVLAPRGTVGTSRGAAVANRWVWGDNSQCRNWSRWHPLRMSRFNFSDSMPAKCQFHLVTSFRAFISHCSYTSHDANHDGLTRPSVAFEPATCRSRSGSAV
jgi:hypothetical protein